MARFGWGSCIFFHKMAVLIISQYKKSDSNHLSIATIDHFSRLLTVLYGNIA